MKAFMMRTARNVGLLGCAALLGACSFFSTTTDGIKSTVGGITDVTSSTTPSESKTAFVTDRFDAIRFEAAKGEGENLESLAVLLGEQDRKGFARWMKVNYAPLFSDLEKPEELLARIEQRRSQNS